MQATKQAVRPSRAETLALWRKYRNTDDRAARDRLIFMLTPMVRHIVFRKVRTLPSNCEVEDFLSCGMEALIRSIDRYDPSRGATLEQYAWTRIQGAVVDELRRHDWAPRSVRRNERAINKARESLVAAHERQPTRSELAAHLGMTPMELAARLDQVAIAWVDSLNTPIGAEDDAAIERIETLESTDRDSDPVANAARREAKARFREAFARLCRQEREVAVLLYTQDLTLREIGERLGVSESRVCQIHAKLRRRLYEQLAGELPLFAEIG
jgi:RNA polymerase sigma factor FliA